MVITRIQDFSLYLESWSSQGWHRAFNGRAWGTYRPVIRTCLPKSEEPDQEFQGSSASARRVSEERTTGVGGTVTARALLPVGDAARWTVALAVSCAHSRTSAVGKSTRSCPMPSPANWPSHLRHSPHLKGHFGSVGHLDLHGS